MSRIVAVYIDLELKGSVTGKEFPRDIIHRIVSILENYLKDSFYDDDNDYILEAFVNMERLIKAHKELIDLLFK